MRIRFWITISATAFATTYASIAVTKDIPADKLKTGKYLVDAGDCVSCHTKSNGKQFAGGRPIETPFGTIYSPNITPDRDTGIGAWSDESFYRAMHSGIGPDGRRLYPAFPYPYFTKMTRGDVMAIRAYLSTVEPVSSRSPAPELKWPLEHRALLRGWDLLFFRQGQFVPNRQKSAEWNRGAYLVEGAAHCGACHTPKNIFGADKKGKPLQGNRIQHWFAPMLANDPRIGLGSWTVDEVAEYLKTGRNAHSGATGLMAEVVANSTSKLTDSDLHAIAVYVKDNVAPVPQTPQASAKPDAAQMAAGKAIFSDACTACHQTNGEGIPRIFPPLRKNVNVQSEDPTSVLRVIIEGGPTVTTDARPTTVSMPSFGWKLTDEQIAAVANYVRNSWGNYGSIVGTDQVHRVRSQLHAKTQ